MGFKPGQPKPPGSGKKKGSITKDRQMLLDKAKQLGVDPFEILLRFAAGDWEGLGYAAKTRTIYTAMGGHFEKDNIEAELRVKAASEASRYMLPTLKSVDVNLTDKRKPTMHLTVNFGAAAELPAKPKEIDVTAESKAAGDGEPDTGSSGSDPSAAPVSSVK